VTSVNDCLAKIVMTDLYGYMKKEIVKVVICMCVRKFKID